MLQSLNLTPIVAQHPVTVSCSNWEEIFGVFTAGAPVIALTAHTGNWDLLAAYTIARGVPLTTIGREARSPVLQEVLKGVRGAYGVETIWRSDRSGVKRLIERLRQGGVVAALIDQDTRVESSFVPFFGTPAKTPNALVALGKRCNARFIKAFLFQTGPHHFEIFAEEIPPGHTSDDAILAEYNTRLEGLIRRFPEQWVWFHKRWRSQPGLGTLSSHEYLQWLAGKPARQAADTTGVRG
jgi:KDO2-lipid IV(A) lauroyltransferase